jgi:hypothetical protein
LIQVMVDNIVGTIGANIFVVSESPAFLLPGQESYTGAPYLTGYNALLTFMRIGALSVPAMVVSMRRENKKRAASEHNHVLELAQKERNNLGDHHSSFGLVL